MRPLRWRLPAERYLPAILDLEEAGVAPIRARPCERFDASHTTVDANVRRLETSGYVRLGHDRVLVLTPDGRELAATLQRNFGVAEQLLAVLGVEETTAAGRRRALGARDVRRCL